MQDPLILQGLEFQFQPKQEIGSCLRIVEVLCDQFTSISSWYEIAKGVAVWLTEFIENIIDEQVDLQAFEISRLRRIANS
jgi:hypothetical protein